jgi:hypothetical protein
MKVYPVFIHMAPPDGDFPGIVEEGWFTIADSDVVTLCTREGIPVVDASGRKRSALVKDRQRRVGCYARACRSAGAPRASIGQSAIPKPPWLRACGPPFRPDVRRAAVVFILEIASVLRLSPTLQEFPARLEGKEVSCPGAGAPTAPTSLGVVPRE